VTTECHPFVKFLARGGYLFLNLYLRLGNQIFDFFNGWVSKIFATKNISLRCHPPP
jgi:hypothetical protein